MDVAVDHSRQQGRRAEIDHRRAGGSGAANLRNAIAAHDDDRIRDHIPRPRIKHARGAHHHDLIRRRDELARVGRRGRRSRPCRAAALAFLRLRKPNKKHREHKGPHGLDPHISSPD